MELTEIWGNARLYFQDKRFDLYVGTEASHSALLDSYTEFDFCFARDQYLRMMDVAKELHRQGEDFSFFLHVYGGTIEDAPTPDKRNLYSCHVQRLQGHLYVDLLLPGQEDAIVENCPISDRAVGKALEFAYGGFVHACVEFKPDEIDLRDSAQSLPLELYCASDDKQALLRELMRDPTLKKFLNDQIRTAETRRTAALPSAHQIQPDREGAEMA